MLCATDQRDLVRHGQKIVDSHDDIEHDSTSRPLFT